MSPMLSLAGGLSPPQAASSTKDRTRTAKRINAPAVSDGIARSSPWRSRRSRRSRWRRWRQDCARSPARCRAGCRCGRRAAPRRPPAPPRGHEQRQVEPVALVAVFGLEDAEGAMVVRVLVDVERDEGQDAGDGRDEGQRAGRRQRIAGNAAPAAAEPCQAASAMPRRGCRRTATSPAAAPGPRPRPPASGCPENRLPQQEVMTSALRPRKYCSSIQALAASSGASRSSSAYLMRTSG
jgi:hypothetical protein